MFPEFGQAPLCLQLDLDSYEGAPAHMAAFRGRSGWVMAARATIQSEHDLMHAVLLAACDEYENPLPAYRAAQLVSCDWSNLSECREPPPDLLDDLLCEEEGALFARWQRSANVDLARLYDQAQHDLAVIDARAAAVQRRADHEIRDLQRRRRQADASPDARAALSHLIAQIEADSDAALAAAGDRRAALRREIDAAEEALWDRGDVLIEVEPMWRVRWEAALPPRPRSVPQVSLIAARVHGGPARAPTGRVIAALIVEPERPPPAPRSTSGPRVAASDGVTGELQAMGHGLYQVEEHARRATQAGLGVVQAQAAVLHHRARITALKREQDVRSVVLAAKRADLANTTRVSRGDVKHAPNPRAPAAPASASSVRGSPRPVSPPPVRSVIAVPTPTKPLSLAALEEERTDLATALKAHERRGASKADGKGYLLRYRAQREEMLARLGRIDAQLAAVRIRLRTTT